ncbi:MAG: hypothetical protein ACC683_00795 [Acidimicrobiia bacterium]
MSIRTVLVAIAAAIVLAACGIIGDGSVTVTSDPGEGTDTTQAPDTTSPDTTQAPDTTLPDTTQAPDTTVPEGDDADTTPWWVLLLVLGAFLVLIIAFVSRGSKKKVVVGPPPTSWKDSARRGYADARWLYDAMSEDLAIWRGNATFDSTTEFGATAATALADTWRQLDGRIGKASDHLYSLEAAAPDQRTAQAANAAVASMRSVRTAVDARAEARMNYRTVQARSDTDQIALQDAREREVRASRNLAEARSAYGTALTNLSTVL